MTPNAQAFLSMIAHAEGTARAADSYRVTFGFKYTIVSLADHPSITGEWFGQSLAFLGPAYTHKISTAAGRYQITKPTWQRLRNRLGLSNFSPGSQDDAALQLIKEARALDAVNDGRLSAAVRLCAGTWASLPGSTSGQPQVQLAVLEGSFTSAGGALA